MTKIIGVSEARAIMPKPSINGSRPRIDEAQTDTQRGHQRHGHRRCGNAARIEGDADDRLGRHDVINPTTT